MEIKVVAGRARIGCNEHATSPAKILTDNCDGCFDVADTASVGSDAQSARDASAHLQLLALSESEDSVDIAGPQIIF